MRASQVVLELGITCFLPNLSECVDFRSGTAVQIVAILVLIHGLSTRVFTTLFRVKCCMEVVECLRKHSRDSGYGLTRQGLAASSRKLTLAHPKKPVVDPLVQMAVAGNHVV